MPHWRRYILTNLSFNFLHEFCFLHKLLVFFIFIFIFFSGFLVFRDICWTSFFYISNWSGVAVIHQGRLGGNNLFFLAAVEPCLPNYHETMLCNIYEDWMLWNRCQMLFQLLAVQQLMLAFEQSVLRISGYTFFWPSKYSECEK